MAQEERSTAEGNGEAEHPVDLQEETSRDEVALTPSEAGDPAWIVASKIPPDIRERYDVYSYRNAAVVLSEARDF